LPRKIESYLGIYGSSDGQSILININIEKVRMEGMINPLGGVAHAQHKVDAGFFLDEAGKIINPHTGFFHFGTVRESP